MSFNLIEFLENFDFTSISIDDEDLLNFIDDIKPKGAAKTTEEIIQIHEKEYKDAVLSSEIADIKEAGFVVSDQVPKNTELLRDKYKGDELRNILTLINKSAMIYSFVFGNYTPARSWIKLQGTTYVRLSPLRSTGKHSVLTTVFRRQIAGLLSDKKKDNAILSILKRGGIEVKDEKRQFAFPKGHFLNAANSDAVAKDLKVIFEQMREPAGNRNFSKLSFFNK